MAFENVALLVQDKKLGPPEMTDGSPNAMFWEGTEIYIKSGWELYKKDPKYGPTFVKYLKGLLNTHAVEALPEKNRAGFKKLRDELLAEPAKK